MSATRAIVTVMAGLSILALTSAPGAQQNVPSNTKLQRTDRSFIQKAADGGQAEVELGRLAQEKGASDTVKQFGQRMVDDHGNANKELMELAQNKGVKLEDKTTKHDRLRDRLAKLQGQEFDREYVKAMVKDHKQDVAEFRRMHSGAVDPNLKAWVDKTLPTLEDHLKTIEGIQAQMTGSKK
jgi:putative membrane protein